MYTQGVHGIIFIDLRPYNKDSTDVTRYVDDQYSWEGGREGLMVLKTLETILKIPDNSNDYRIVLGGI